MDDVSRETPPGSSSSGGPAPPDPAWVTEAFHGDRAIYRYVDLLASEGTVRGLIGPREVPRLWDRHVRNCAAASPAFPESARVADVGSGAGLPGLVLALARPDLHITLIEPLLRRTTFLGEVVAELGLTRVEVVRARAEDVEETFDVVTSRAVAPLEKLLVWCLPLCRPRGLILALKGATAQAELDDAAQFLRTRSIVDARVVEYPAGADGFTRVVRLESPLIGRTKKS